MKNILKRVALLALLVGVLGIYAPEVKANNDGDFNSRFVSAHSSLKADALIKLESSTGVALGANGNIKAIGAKVTSVSSNEVNATTSFGNSALNFVIKIDGDTKINGKNRNGTSIASLKVGDKVSFSGIVTASSSSSIAVDADHLVSRAFVKNEVKADSSDDNGKDKNEDNKERDKDKEARKGWFGKMFRWFWK